MHAESMAGWTHHHVFLGGDHAPPHRALAAVKEFIPILTT
jgi:hypothetical protein